MPNNDYVKREDIFPAVMEIAKEIVYGDQDDDKVVDIINSIPAADVEPKRKTGRWKIAGAFDDFYQCPECGEMWPIFRTIEWKCCPICVCKIITNRPKGEAECLFE